MSEKKTHCLRGHAFTSANTGIQATGARFCRTCRKASYRKRRDPNYVFAPKTHCIHGHEFTPENTFLRDGGRRCKACRSADNRRAYAKADAQARRDRQRESRKRRLVKDPDYDKRRHNERMKKYIAERVRRFYDYRETLQCERCGFDDGRALDFHHRDPSQKKFSIGYMVRRFSLEDLMEEIAKCEVICANCHRIEHFENLPPNKLRPYAQPTYAQPQAANPR